jgi:FkbM family methyltransferase
VTDWTPYARHELSFDEARELGSQPKYWGWADGMFIAGNDDLIALRFKDGHGYESVTREIWKRVCKDAPLVADIGTHSGVFALDAYRAGAKLVFCAEPHPINFSRLVMNLRYNGFDYGGCFFGAIGDENKVGSLLVKNGYMVHAGGRMGLKNKNGMEYPAKCVRLDSVLNRDGWKDLKALKIDAENYTPKVINGMAGIFAEGYRPDLIIECLEEGMGGYLKGLGYRFWRIWESGTVEEVEDLLPYNPDNNYNGTHEYCRNRFASVNGLP